MLKWSEFIRLAEAVELGRVLPSVVSAETTENGDGTNGGEGGVRIVKNMRNILVNHGCLHDASAYSSQHCRPMPETDIPAANKKARMKKDAVRQGRFFGLEPDSKIVVTDADVHLLPYYPKEFLRQEDEWLKKEVLPAIGHCFYGCPVNIRRKLCRGFYLLTLALDGGSYSSSSVKSERAVTSYF